MCKWILTRRRTGRGGGRTPGVSAGSDGQTGASLCPIAEANLRDAVQLLRYLFIQFKANEICARVHRITISFNAIYRTSFVRSEHRSPTSSGQCVNIATISLQFRQLKPNKCLTILKIFYKILQPKSATGTLNRKAGRGRLVNEFTV